MKYFELDKEEKELEEEIEKGEWVPVKAKAIEEGIPYQTLASSILHKATAE